jgi:flagellar assembly protein FliH
MDETRMSLFEAWPADAVATARAVPIWTRPTAPRFTVTPGGIAAGFSPWATDPEPQPQAQPEPVAEPDPAMELDAVRADAFAQGFEAGARTEQQLLADERRALARLAESLETLRPEPAADLARLLAESVSRLVRQVCGEVEPDPALMHERTAAIAALIQEETGPARLRLNPADQARLDGATLAMTVLVDPSLPEGTILAETASGWIEDGPAIRLERLRSLLETMGCTR